MAASRRARSPRPQVWILSANDDPWELHHYLLAWVASLFCAFDHPLSLGCLALTTGIYVQGLAAYGPAMLSEGAAEYS